MKDILGTFRLDYEYDIEYEYDFSILVFRLHISSHELQFLPKTNVKNKGSGNVTGLKLKTHTRTQSRTRSPIWRSLFSNRGLRCPQGPDLADCQNLQGILEKCFIRHLRTEMTSFFSENSLLYIAQDICFPSFTTLQVEWELQVIRLQTCVIMAAADQAVLLNVYRRYIPLLFQCIPDPKVPTQNEK